MSDELVIEGKQYISSKRAAEITSYAQDYIGQLARKGLIAAQRVGGLWYISMKSLQSYKERADTYQPIQPQRGNPQEDPDSLISFGGKDHISAARAAKITGYHQDYVGQLARSGTVLSRLVGNRWYVEREGILAHKDEKDRLLWAVQAESVGLPRGNSTSSLETRTDDPYSAQELYRYSSDSGDLLPALRNTKEGERGEKLEMESSVVRHTVPIRVLQQREILHHIPHVKHVKSRVRTPRKTIFYGALATTAATIVIVLSFSIPSLKNAAIYALSGTQTTGVVSKMDLTASASKGIQGLAEFMERYLTNELVYRRPTSDFK